MCSPYAVIEYNISQGKDKHTLTSEELATLLEEAMSAVEEDRKTNTDLFTAKYKRLIRELKI